MGAAAPLQVEAAAPAHIGGTAPTHTEAAPAQVAATPTQVHDLEGTAAAQIKGTAVAPTDTRS